MLIDTHCHLFAPPLGDSADAVVARATEAGVGRLVVPAFDVASWDAVARLARVHASVVVPALGLHPWMAVHPVDVEDLGRRLDDVGAAAVGEIGLDFAVAKDGCARALQIEVLDAQLALAHTRDLPVILHCRGGLDALAELLDKHAPLSGVAHGFGRGPEVAERLVAAGLHVAFGGLVTRPGAHRARAAVAAVPAERLLLETDAPAVALEGITADRVEPAHLPQIAAAVAELRGTSIEVVARQTTRNARALFRLDDREARR